MSTSTTSTTPPAAVTPPVPAPPPAPEPTATPDPPGAEALGDAGKKALDAMKAERHAAKQEAADLRAKLDAVLAKEQGREAEHAAALAAQKVRDDALATANARILKAEVRAAAAGKLADPQDALKFLDLSTFEVGTDGEVDGGAVEAAILDLIKRKPYLAAAQGGPRFQAGADGGARKESQTSIDEQIAAATKAGNIPLVIALKQRRFANASKS